MALPNFLGIGAAKSGTTTLHDILIQHPDVFLPDIKEAHFFDYPRNYKLGLNWYERKIFGKYKQEKAIGEITPSYLYLDYVPERIYKNLGKDLKLIVTLRNPVDRAYSQYLMNVRRGYEKETFEKGIKQEQSRIKKGLQEKIHFSYLDRGFYSIQLRRYMKLFPKENMFFIVFEKDIKQNLNNTVRNILGFLNVDVVNLNLEIKSNPSSIPRFKLISNILYTNTFFKKVGKLLLPFKISRKKTKMVLDKLNQKPYIAEKIDLELKNTLIRKYFLEDILELENLINRDLSIWHNTNK